VDLSRDALHITCVLDLVLFEDFNGNMFACESVSAHADFAERALSQRLACMKVSKKLVKRALTDFVVPDCLVLLFLPFSHDQSQPLRFPLAALCKLCLCELSLGFDSSLLLSFLVLTHYTVYKLIIPADFLKMEPTAMGMTEGAPGGEGVDIFQNNHDLIGVDGIIRAQKNEIEKKKVRLRPNLKA